MAAASPVLFFDGLCNLCNGAVQWFLLNDREGNLRFASLQSELAQELLPAAGVDPTALSSLVLYDNGVAYTESDGALRATALLGGVYRPLARFLRFFPRVLRDAVYRLIAANRYRWFGKREACLLPRPEWKARFLG
ncbi:thiol-disulfide oxidoreductase DCC family protein [Neolewinella lacunae]|uniref:Thiol-disulfide oxidoreductase DCC family protein n=1 Tax=Neolewinella lacunae TaxID=1517758 RepID=A0A923PK12_9BACT|nr:thiol-disulfide oxidoreductase DCC family protein [Neolewinella lacunae]MBC6992734.1 thiol-disulfide oxidoreductase DCC family protein [Neolewinella lacunae]MDN3635978.1 thiol-disulfide oxidoreductase DCC family protein [Neolewinella lacunae]